jgi:hypothetical protein
MTAAANDPLPPRQARVLDHLRELGGEARTVELVPYQLLRKAGVLATPEAAAQVMADLAALEQAGSVVLGEPAGAGVMIMLATARDLPVLLTAERLVTLYGWMNEHERAMLARWEARHLAIGGPHTVDWPGWPTIYRRRYP